MQPAGASVADTCAAVANSRRSARAAPSRARIAASSASTAGSRLRSSEALCGGVRGGGRQRRRRRRRGGGEAQHLERHVGEVRGAGGGIVDQRDPPERHDGVGVAAGAQPHDVGRQRQRVDRPGIPAGGDQPGARLRQHAGVGGDDERHPGGERRGADVRDVDRVGGVGEAGEHRRAGAAVGALEQVRRDAPVARRRRRGAGDHHRLVRAELPRDALAGRRARRVDRRQPERRQRAARRRRHAEQDVRAAGVAGVAVGEVGAVGQAEAERVADLHGEARGGQRVGQRGRRVRPDVDAGVGRGGRIAARRQGRDRGEERGRGAHRAIAPHRLRAGKRRWGVSG
jgi:hypothetical protein